MIAMKIPRNISVGFSPSGKWMLRSVISLMNWVPIVTGTA